MNKNEFKRFAMDYLRANIHGIINEGSKEYDWIVIERLLDIEDFEIDNWISSVYKACEVLDTFYNEVEDSNDDRVEKAYYLYYNLIEFTVDSVGILVRKHKDKIVTDVDLKRIADAYDAA